MRLLLSAITALDLCAYLGLAAVGAVTVNLMLGLLMSLRYSPVRYWPHRRVNVFALHQATAYLAVAFTLTHPIVLLFVSARTSAGSTSSGRFTLRCSRS